MNFTQREIVYKTVDGVDLRLHLFEPSGGEAPRPAIVFFFGLRGEADATVPFAEVKAFAAAMAAAGNRCELAAYAGEAHGFFNYRDGSNPMYENTVRRMDEFLTSLGWLTGEATIGENA